MAHGFTEDEEIEGADYGVMALLGESSERLMKVWRNPTKPPPSTGTEGQAPSVLCLSTSGRVFIGWYNHRASRWVEHDPSFSHDGVVGWNWAGLMSAPVQKQAQ